MAFGTRKPRQFGWMKHSYYYILYNIYCRGREANPRPPSHHEQGIPSPLFSGTLISDNHGQNAKVKITTNVKPCDLIFLDRPSLKFRIKVHTKYSQFVICWCYQATSVTISGPISYLYNPL
jgi:hypothetical protein